MPNRPAAVTRALRHPDKPGAGAKKRRHLNPDDKAHAVMSEFKRGTLRSGGSGEHVKNRAQAIAIAMSEADKVADGEAHALNESVKKRTAKIKRGRK